MDWAVDNGITLGCDGGAGFCGTDNVTRGENISFVSPVDKWDGSAQDIETTITATSANQETSSDVAWLAGQLLVNRASASVSYAGLYFSEPFQANFQTIVIRDIIAVTTGEYTLTGRATVVGAMPPGGLAYIYNQTVTAIFVPLDGAGLPRSSPPPSVA